MTQQGGGLYEEESSSSLMRILSRTYYVIVSPSKLLKEVTLDPDLQGPVLFLAVIALTSFFTSLVGWSKVKIQKQTNIISPPVSWLLLESGVAIFWSLLTPIFVFSTYVLLFKIMRARGEGEKAFFSAFCYAYFPILILYVITLILTFSLPSLVFPKEVREEDFQQIYSEWRSSLPYLLMRILTPVFYFWQLSLATLAVHYAHKVSWKASIAASTIIFFETTLIFSWPVGLISLIRSFMAG